MSLPTSSPASSASGNSSGSQSSSGKTRAPRNSKKPQESTTTNEAVLGYYSKSMMWTGVLRESILRFDRYIAIQDGFPHTTFDKHIAEEIIQKVIEERDATSDTRELSCPPTDCR